MNRTYMPESGNQMIRSIDNSAILFLAQMDARHTNSYRFSATMTEPVCPEMLQRAAERIYNRFPLIFAGFRPSFFRHDMVSASRAPRVCQASELLATMSRQEIENCAYRILYEENRIHMEAFHALTDGFGAMASMQALLAEYLFLRYGQETPERLAIPQPGTEEWEDRLRDSYTDHADRKAFRPKNRRAWQVEAENRDWTVREKTECFSTDSLLWTARKYGVTMTTLLSAILAQAIMELQRRKKGSKKLLPVRIMVPVNLRKLFPSRTFRNFVLYALPTLEPEDWIKPLEQRLRLFHNQMKHQTDREYLGGQIAANVKIQRSLIYRMSPRTIKHTVLRFANRFFGECNSCITMTNLGNAGFSEEMRTYVNQMAVYLTPRRRSPYNCGIQSLGEKTTISITRFCPGTELEDLFFGMLRGILEET